VTSERSISGIVSLFWTPSNRVHIIAQNPLAGFCHQRATVRVKFWSTLRTAKIAARLRAMKTDEKKLERNPTASKDNLAQQYQELLKLRCELLSLEKHQKQTKWTSAPNRINP
jgi:hypothetical protein